MKKHLFVGQQIPITPLPLVDRLVPEVSIFQNVMTLEANFGDDMDKPFQYDIKNCPGMGMEWI
jgi:hypothetical protein